MMVSMSEEELPKWRHRFGDVYRFVSASIVGNPDFGFSTTYYVSPEEHRTLAGARREGFEEHDVSDDFNIGVWRGGRLVALTWMGEVTDDDPELMARIESEGFVRHG